MNAIPMMNRTDGMKSAPGPSPFRNSRTAATAAASKNTMPMMRFSVGGVISYRSSCESVLTSPLALTLARKPFNIFNKTANQKNYRQARSLFYE
jgi:hypothetical protein